MMPFFSNAKSESVGKFGGKRILTIHGKEDQLVPYDQGKEDIERIQMECEEGGGVMKVQLMEGLGHVVTVDMVKMTAEWIWKYCLTNKA
jgi:predicted esterase